MSPAQTVRFPLRIEAATGQVAGPEIAEEFALDLRRELADLGVTRVDREVGGPAPEGARALELLAVFGFLITAVQAGESLAKVVEAVRRCAARFSKRGTALRVTVGDSDVELATAAPEDVERLVQHLLSLPAAARVGTRSALIVANARYDDPALAQLRAPTDDADALIRVLGDPAIGDFQTEALIDADERTIRRRVATFFADRDRDDVLLLHFSCHGIKDERGRLHLAATDTELSLLGATAIPASFINDLLAGTQSQRVVLVLDCCYSGAFARGATARADNGIQIADEFGVGSGRIVLTASSATEYSFEDGALTRAQGKPSAFTGALVRGLETGEADLDADGEISIDELYDYTYRTVRESTPGQGPRKWTFGVEGSLVIARSARPATLPAAILDDLASDRVVLRLEGIRALEQILRGGKAGLRASAEAHLARIRTTDDSERVRQAAAELLIAVGHPAVVRAAVPAARVDQQLPLPVQPVGARSVAEPAVTEPVIAQPAAIAEPMFAESMVVAPMVAEMAPVVPAPRASEPEPTAARHAPGPVTPARSAAPDGGSWPLITAAILVLASALSYASVGIWADSLTSRLLISLVAPTEVLAAVAVIATKQVRWAGAIAGLLAWEWLYPTIVWNPADTQSHHGGLKVANILGMSAQVLATIALMRGRHIRDSVAGGHRARFAALIAVLAVPASILAATGLVDYDTTDEPVRIILALWCAIVVPLVVCIAPGSVRLPLIAGWLVGGGFIALTTTITLARAKESLTGVAWEWTLFVLVAVAMLAATRSLRRVAHSN